MVPSSAALSARRLRTTLSPLIEAATQESQADRYRKHFPAFAHVWMLILHVMSGNSSLRQSYSQQSADSRLRTRLLKGMPEEWVSYSQLARSSSSRPPECFEHLLAALVRRAQSRAEPEHALELLRKVQLLDSTFFSLSAKASPWSVHGEHEPGVRLQAGLEWPE